MVSVVISSLCDLNKNALWTNSVFCFFVLYNLFVLIHLCHVVGPHSVVITIATGTLIKSAIKVLEQFECEVHAWG